MHSITVDWQGLKQMAQEFLAVLPTATPEELEQCQKCFALGFLGMEGTAGERLQAQSLLQIVTREYLRCQASLR